MLIASCDAQFDTQAYKRQSGMLKFAEVHFKQCGNKYHKNVMSLLFNLTGKFYSKWLDINSHGKCISVETIVLLQWHTQRKWVTAGLAVIATP